MLLDIFHGCKDYFLMKAHTKKDLQVSLKVGKCMICVSSIQAIIWGLSANSVLSCRTQTQAGIQQRRGLNGHVCMRFDTTLIHL